nr:uncharacterized protein LOC117222575 [Megalopta genalis]
MTARVDFDRRRRTSLLICFVLVLAVPVAASDKRRHAYEEEKNGKELSKDIEGPKLSSHHEDHESVGKSNRVRSGVQSSKTNTGNSAALNRFLENVLRAQDDFKWIDQAVHEANRAKYWQKSPSELSRVSGSAAASKNHHAGKSRRKRSYDDSMFRRDIDLLDDSQNGVPGSGQSSSKSRTGEPLYNTVPKDWTKTEDICSLSDWLNSKEPAEEKRRDRWIRDYEVDPKNHLLGKGVKDREASPSLEALKETLLQLKKSLNEADKKVHDTAKNVEVEEDVEEQRVRGKKKHDMLSDDEDTADSESSGLPSNLSKREQIDLEDKSNRKAWRTKRTEGNNGPGNPKLYYRAGFGTPYLEDEALKKLHDRKRRRSKAAPTEKRRSVEENAEIPQTEGSCEKDEAFGNVLSNPKSDQKRRGLSRRDSNAMEDRSPRIEEKGEDLVGNSLRTFGPASNGLQAARSSAGPSSEEAEAARKTEETVSAEGEQAIKVFEPQGRLSEDGELTKAALGSDESGAGKLSQKRRTRPESGNINILLKSENKDLIQFSNSRGSKDEAPFVLNTLDVRKKLVLGNEAGEPEKTLSTVYNVKMKSLVDPADPKNSEHDVVPLVGGAGIFGKQNGDMLKDTLAFMGEGKEATNAATVKESLINRDKDGSRVFYDDSTGGRTGVNTGGTSLAKENAGDEVKSREEQPEEDAKGKLTENNDAPPVGAAASPADAGSSAPDDDLKQYEAGKKTKYHEIVIVPDGVADLKLNDAFGRRILQYMEYSNDDVENAESNYDMEEDTRQAGEAENSVQPLRTLRSPVKDKGKAKVNVLISDKLGKKKKTKRESVRKRREPIEFIAYYDYDDDVEQQVRDATGDQEPVKTNSERNAIVSNLGLEAAAPPVKDDQQAKEMEKQWRRKEKLKNKTPVQYYLSDEVKNETATTPKPNESSGLANVETFDIAQDGSRHQSGRSNVRREGKEMKLLDEAILKPMKYIMSMDEAVVPGSIDDYQCTDPKNDRKESVVPLYEELKHLYDWSEDEAKIRPRIKGDQRLYHELEDKEDPAINVVVEPREEDNSASEPSPNLLPLLLAHDGSAGGETSEKSYRAESSQQLESPAASNVSRSNYFALKSTDDMFKGGPEQANSTVEKLRGPGGGIGADGGPRLQKVNGGRNDAPGEKDAAGWSLTGRRQYIDTDSRSPYETRKYPVPPAAQFRREQVQNLDRPKQTVISPRDLHESFVEPSDWVDDLDEDAAVRLGRGLKTIEDTGPRSNATKRSISSSTEIARTGSSSNVPNAVGSEVGFSADPSLRSSGKTDNARIRRETDSLDDASERRDSFDGAAERNRYGRDQEQDDLPRLSDPDTDLEYNYPEKAVDRKRRAKVARSPKAKKETDRKKKKKKARGFKKKKKKKKGRKQKKSGNTRKRRHRKKHSENSKAKERKKKHKKRGSKNLKHRAEVKKSKTDHGEAKVLGDSQRLLQEKRHRKKTPDVDNAQDQQRKMVSLLLAADNVQDESQMDTALHGAREPGPEDVPGPGALSQLQDRRRYRNQQEVPTGSRRYRDQTHGRVDEESHAAPEPSGVRRG